MFGGAPELRAGTETMRNQDSRSNHGGQVSQLRQQVLHAVRITKMSQTMCE